MDRKTYTPVPLYAIVQIICPAEPDGIPLTCPLIKEIAVTIEERCMNRWSHSIGIGYVRRRPTSLDRLQFLERRVGCPWSTTPIQGARSTSGTDVEAPVPGKLQNEHRQITDETYGSTYSYDARCVGEHHYTATSQLFHSGCPSFCPQVESCL